MAAAGGGLLDTPVSGGNPGATPRTRITFVGFDQLAYEASRPVFESFTTTVRRMGDVGSGQ
ncbi:NAD(P)-binding domain-containing protein [Deinococcus humi]|uniref:NAD(P)-binding domain-containing protein n=1 Tax=Deinococcus humi TaxID=662880 RepID=UPI00161CE869|nr:hypothetical protein GCM10008949_38810 [Deinococcus humi]